MEAPSRSAARAPAVRLIRQAKNVGFAAGNNAGIRQTTGELILLLNNDTIVPAGAIDRPRRTAEGHAVGWRRGSAARGRLPGRPSFRSDR